jgi:hypothetical protein
MQSRRMVLGNLSTAFLTFLNNCSPLLYRIDQVSHRHFLMPCNTEV